MRKAGFEEMRFGKRLTDQAASRLLKNIDPDENEKAAANEQEAAGGGKQGDLTPNPEKIDEIQ
jgi:hypothetical protein